MEKKTGRRQGAPSEWRTCEPVVMRRSDSSCAARQPGLCRVPTARAGTVAGLFVAASIGSGQGQFANVTIIVRPQEQPVAEVSTPRHVPGFRSSFMRNSPVARLANRVSVTVAMDRFRRSGPATAQSGADAAVRAKLPGAVEGRYGRAVARSQGQGAVGASEAWERIGVADGHGNPVPGESLAGLPLTHRIPMFTRAVA